MRRQRGVRRQRGNARARVVLTNRFIACITLKDASRDVPRTEGASPTARQPLSQISKPVHVPLAALRPFH